MRTPIQVFETPAPHAGRDGETQYWKRRFKEAEQECKAIQRGFRMFGGESGESGEEKIDVSRALYLDKGALEGSVIGLVPSTAIDLVADLWH